MGHKELSSFRHDMVAFCLKEGLSLKFIFEGKKALFDLSQRIEALKQYLFKRSRQSSGLSYNGVKELVIKHPEYKKHVLTWLQDLGREDRSFLLAVLVNIEQF